MSTLPPPPAGGDFAPPPAGTFPAVCYRVIDLGTQQTTYLGETKRQHKVLLSWELKDEDAMVETDSGKQPMTIHQRYTWSTHEKAALRKHLESWRGKTFTDADFGPGGFDIRNIIGVGCLLGIVHNQKGDKIYANISSVSKLPKGMDAGTPENETVFLWLDPELFDKDAFAKLSDGLRDTVRTSPQYQQLTNGAVQEPYTDADNGGGVTGHLDEDAPFNDPIPF